MGWEFLKFEGGATKFEGEFQILGGILAGCALLLTLLIDIGGNPASEIVNSTGRCRYEALMTFFSLREHCAASSCSVKAHTKEGNTAFSHSLNNLTIFQYFFEEVIYQFMRPLTLQNFRQRFIVTSASETMRASFRKFLIWLSISRQHYVTRHPQKLLVFQW